jgi:hypothetical protein
VGFAGTPGISPLRTASLGSFQRRKVADNFPVDPVDLTGAELANSIISVDQFLALAKLTPQSLAAMEAGFPVFQPR